VVAGVASDTDPQPGGRCGCGSLRRTELELRLTRVTAPAGCKGTRHCGAATPRENTVRTGVTTASSIASSKIENKITKIKTWIWYILKKLRTLAIIRIFKSKKPPKVTSFLLRILCMFFANLLPLLPIIILFIRSYYNVFKHDVEHDSSFLVFFKEMPVYCSFRVKCIWENNCTVCR
jgi:hypothetical protein